MSKVRTLVCSNSELGTTTVTMNRVNTLVTSIFELGTRIVTIGKERTLVCSISEFGTRTVTMNKVKTLVPTLFIYLAWYQNCPSVISSTYICNQCSEQTGPYNLLFLPQDKFGLWIVSLAAKIPKTEADIAKVDRTALVMFSCSFMVFNLLYWSNMLKN